MQANDVKPEMAWKWRGNGKKFYSSTLGFVVNRFAYRLTKMFRVLVTFEVTFD